MKDFRRLCLAVIVIAAFSMPALAGETQGPGCANPGETSTPPGETQAPPCSIAPGDMQGPGYTTSDTAQTESYSVTEDVVAPTIDSMLSLILTLL